MANKIEFDVKEIKPVYDLDYKVGTAIQAIKDGEEIATKSWVLEQIKLALDAQNGGG